MSDCDPMGMFAVPAATNLPDGGTGDAPKKRGPGRPTKAEKAAREASQHAAGNRWVAGSACELALQHYRGLPGLWRGRQAGLKVAVDQTTSTQPDHHNIRGGLQGIADGVAAEPVAQGALTCTLLGFNTTCEPATVGRGKLVLPDWEYEVGTRQRPLLDGTAGAVRAFSQHLAEQGAMRAEGVTVVVSDFWFDDHDAQAVLGWKAFMKAQGQVVVAAMVATPNTEVATLFADPLPPVPVARVSFKALFTTLASSISGSLTGRSRLLDLLRAEFASLKV